MKGSCLSGKRIKLLLLSLGAALLLTACGSSNDKTVVIYRHETQPPAEISTTPPVTAPVLPPPVPAPPSESAEPQTAQDYILNTSSKKIHRPDCASVADIKGSNREDVHGLLSEFEDMGYVPCKRCKPS